MAHPRRGHRGAAALLSTLALAACGGGSEERRGFLVDSGGEIRLCDALAESYPPQCGGDSLRVEGELPAVRWSESQGVLWTDDQIVLRGEIEDGVIRVGG